MISTASIEYILKNMEVFEGVFTPYFSIKDDALWSIPKLNEGRPDVLDMGSGTGILSIILAIKYPNLNRVIATDIDPKAVANSKKNIDAFSESIVPLLEVRQGDLFESIEEVFDVIIFNNAHLPSFDPTIINPLPEYLFDAYVDLDYKTTQRFIENLKRHMKPGGVALYTFSEWGDLEFLIEKANKEELIILPYSVMPFKDKYLKEERLWYNLIIKRLEDTSAQELFNRYKLAFQSISNIFQSKKQRNNLKDIYLTQLNSIKPLLEGLFIQVGNFAPVSENNWIISGFSYPDSNYFELHDIHLLSTSKNISKSDRLLFEQFIAKLDTATKRIQAKRKINLVVDYLRQNKDLDNVEIHRNLKDKDSVEIISQTEFSKKISLACSISQKTIIPSELSINETTEYLLRSIDKAEYKNFNDDELLKVGKNIFLNYLSIYFNNINLDYLNFKRQSIPLIGEESTMYFFSSAPYSESIEKLKNSFFEIFQTTSFIIQSPLWEYVNLQASVKAALSQVLNRNLSHHMGSHVLSQIVFMDNYEGCSYKLKLFHSYLRSRMDFLADVSTSLPTTTTTRYFKQDVLNGFKEQDVVLQFITGTEVDLSKEKSALFRTLKSGKLLHPEDLPIAIPNFNLGLHAFYVFIENTLRNAFKHSEHSALNDMHGPYGITFDFEDYTTDQQYYKVTMWDNIPHEGIYLKEVLLPRIKSLIEAPILKNGVLREDGWGLLEMKICCLYLRMLAAEKIDLLQNPPILNTIVKTQGKQAFLGYEFYMLKPQLLYLVNWTNEDFPMLEKEKLSLYGIHVLNRIEVENGIPAIRKQLPHEFFIFIGSKEDEQIFHKQYALIPHRRIFYFSDDPKSYLKLAELKSLLRPDHFHVDKLEHYLWLCWSQQLFPDFCPELVLSKADKNAGKPKNLEQSIIFDRHGELLSHHSHKYALVELERSLFYTWYGGSDESNKYNSWYEETSKETGVNWKDLSTQELQLLEAGIDVLVIDERIQKGVEIDNHNPYSDTRQRKKDKLRQMKIEVMGKPDTPKNGQYNLDLNQMGRFSESEKQTVENWIKVHAKANRTQYLIIHLGIIEKLVGTEKEKIRDYLEFLKEKLFKSQNRQDNPALFKKVVITSGRGKSDTMPPNVNFIAYSNIAKYLVEKTGKMSLIKGLMSARCVKYEEKVHHE